jgi:protein-tyrosine phosphatase
VTVDTFQIFCFPWPPPRSFLLIILGNVGGGGRDFDRADIQRVDFCHRLIFVQVPEVTRGLIELVDHSQSALVHNDCSPSMVVHCSLGSDRSSMFVGLNILVQQLRIEKRVDIFTVTRKLRSQRNGLINSFVSTGCSSRQVEYTVLLLQAQYEFLHRAIVNYAELHGLCDS